MQNEKIHKRVRYAAEFKEKVALEALSGAKTYAQIASEYGISPTCTPKEGCKWSPFEVYVEENIMAYLYYGPAMIDFNLIDFGKSTDVWVMLNSFLVEDLRCEPRTERNSRIYAFWKLHLSSNAFMLDFFYACYTL